MTPTEMADRKRQAEKSRTSQHGSIDQARLDNVTRGPLPASRKIYVPGRLHPDLRVPMREIAQSPTKMRPSAAERGATEPAEVLNPPVVVYDTSGPYTDSEVTINVGRGLTAVRQAWIRACGHAEEQPGISSAYGRQRLAEERGAP